MKYIYNKVRILIVSKNRSFLTYRFIIGIAIGGFLGFSYYLLTNYTSHPPAIASTPWFSTIYGIILGGLLSKG